MLDYLITNATVFDGDATDPQQLHIGVKGDKIAYAGSELTTSAANRVIEARDLYLCPGFIDTHASTGLGYTFPNAGDNKLFQGVTTEIIGNCGTSSGPVGDLLVPAMEESSEQIGFEFNWRSLGEWFRIIEDYGLPFNIGSYVGHSTLRSGTCTDRQNVTQAEVDLMCMDPLTRTCVNLTCNPSRISSKADSMIFWKPTRTPLASLINFIDRRSFH